MAVKKYWVVIDVGCIECGIDTEPVGIYDTEEEAKDALEFIERRDHNWRDGGQSYPEVFEMTKGDNFTRTIEGEVVDAPKEISWLP